MAEQGLTSHWTQFRSFRRRCFTGQMTQPTVESLLQRKPFRLSLRISPQRGMSIVTFVHLLKPFDRFRTLDVIWHVHLWVPMTHCVRWVPVPQEKKNFREGEGGQRPSQNMQLQFAAATWRIQTRASPLFAKLLCSLLFVRVF